MNSMDVLLTGLPPALPITPPFIPPTILIMLIHFFWPIRYSLSMSTYFNAVILQATFPIPWNAENWTCRLQAPEIILPYYLSMKKAYTFIISFYSSQFPLIFLRTKNSTKSELWNIFSNFFVLGKTVGKNSPQLHSIWAWSSFDKGPALSITTLRCLRGAVMHPPRRGRRNIHSRAWPQWRGSPWHPRRWQLLGCPVGS